MQHCTLNHASWGVYRGFKDYGQNYGLDAKNYGQKPNTMICFFRRLGSPGFNCCYTNLGGTEGPNENAVQF